MSKSKPPVRDARFRNRPTQSKPPPKRSSRPSDPPRGSAPPPARVTSTKGSRPSAPVHVPETEPSKLPPWLTPNLVVPVLLAIGVAVALYAQFKPESTPAPTASADAATAADASATPTPATADTSARDASAPTTPPANPAATDAATATDGGPGAVVLNGDPVEPEHREPEGPDPRGGRFTLDDATQGLPGTGNLVAEIETSMGTFTCQLLSREAPNTVANFVGLARGLRDFWDPVAGRWTRRPFYDGSIFHRVIPEFMIQGGDLLRSGTGGTGYEFADENVTGHNAAGLLCMANHGPNTNGAQFFITETPNPQLDGSYSIFGRCTPTELVNRIARVEKRGARPVTPVFIQHVRVRRG